MNENQAVRVFKKSEDGRKFVAEYFANVLLRQDFTGYINEHLAADFACALADGLHALLKQRDELLAAPILFEKGEGMKTSLDRKVVVGDYVMLDAAITPPPKHQQVLCGSVKWGTTVKGYFDPAHHDCWLPMPKFPDPVKERYRVEVENGKT